LALSGEGKQFSTVFTVAPDSISVRLEGLIGAYSDYNQRTTIDTFAGEFNAHFYSGGEDSLYFYSHRGTGNLPTFSNESIQVWLHIDTAQQLIDRMTVDRSVAYGDRISSDASQEQFRFHRLPYVVGTYTLSSRNPSSQVQSMIEDEIDSKNHHLDNSVYLVSKLDSMIGFTSNGSLTVTILKGK
jgi:hypothetical protein